MIARQFWYETVICTPARDTVQATFTADLVALLKYSPEAKWMLCQGSYIPNNRIKLVHTAMEAGASYILFIDSDMRFPPDTIGRLLKADKDIVGANCKQRSQNEWTARKNGKFINSTDQKGLEEVDTLGFGVTLIDMKVFKIPEPWFAMPYHTQDKKLIGEDVYFCTVAKEQGFKIWIDHDLSQEVKHTGTVEF